MDNDELESQILIAACEQVEEEMSLIEACLEVEAAAAAAAVEEDVSSSPVPLPLPSPPQPPPPTALQAEAAMASAYLPSLQQQQQQQQPTCLTPPPRQTNRAAAARAARFDDDVWRFVDEDGWFVGGSRYAGADGDTFQRYLDAIDPHLPVQLATAGRPLRVNAPVVVRRRDRNPEDLTPPPSWLLDSVDSDFSRPRGERDPRAANLRNAERRLVTVRGQPLHVDRVPINQDFVTDPWFHFCDLVGPIERWPFFIRRVFDDGRNFDDHNRMLVVNFAVLNGVPWEALDRALAHRFGEWYTVANRQNQCLNRYRYFFNADGSWNVSTRSAAYSYSVRHRGMRTLMDEPYVKKKR